MQGSWAVLKKNSVNLLPGLVAFARESVTAYNTWTKIYHRAYRHGPADFVDQAEAYTPDYWKRGHSQEKNMWVDQRLCEEVSQQEMAQLMRYKVDFWRMCHCLAAGLVFGGYAAPLAVLWLANDTWVPSCFNRTATEMDAWRGAQDMYRYRSAPTYITETKWFFDFHAYPWNATQERAWDDLFEKNNVRRDPALVRPAAEMYDGFLQFYMIKRKSLRYLARSMNIPTSPMLTRLCNSNRVRDYWNMAWNEDHMVMTQSLHESMSDEELQDYAWRRFLAPYDKNLTRAELMQRVRDYFDFLGPKFVQHGQAPNLIILANYVLGYYNDPAFLEEDISALEGNDFEYMASYGKDAFLRRLEFENGPLRDQVEAHTQALISDREKVRKAATKQKIES